MVCQGFKAPEIIDPRLLDPKFALEQVEDDNQGTSTDNITSLKRLLTFKRNRGGYEETHGGPNLYAECDLMEFITSQNPHQYLSGFNKFRLSDEAKAAIEDMGM